MNKDQLKGALKEFADLEICDREFDQRRNDRVTVQG